MHPFLIGLIGGLVGLLAIYIRNLLRKKLEEKNKPSVGGKPGSGWTGIPGDEIEDPTVIKKAE